MTELSLHILDIAQNSVNAGATEIFISILEDIGADKLSIRIEDNGRGIEPDLLEKVQDPFYTTGKKKTGLGIPLLKQQAEQAEGDCFLESSPGLGTKLLANFRHSHIDRQPMGDIAATLTSLFRSYPNIEWIYSHNLNMKNFTLDTREIRKEIGDLPINQPEVINFLKEMIDENLDALSGEGE